MSILTDFFHTTRLTFVKKDHESGDIWTYYFTPNHAIKHTAGQHGLFILSKFKGLHIFSLASAPEEEYVAIGTHARAESAYKQRLEALQPGDTMTMIGPVLNFVLPKQPRPVVFLAQGIGITPFRSMLIYNASSLDTTLIHVDNPEHTYRYTTEALSTQSFYVHSPQEFTEALELTIAAKANAALYYISGSPRFVAATKETLLKNGINTKNIKKDSFLGY
jgi:ferredoxin-NADP reductase